MQVGGEQGGEDRLLIRQDAEPGHPRAGPVCAGLEPPVVVYTVLLGHGRDRETHIHRHGHATAVLAFARVNLAVELGNELDLANFYPVDGHFQEQLEPQPGPHAGQGPICSGGHVPDFVELRQLGEGLEDATPKAQRADRHRVGVAGGQDVRNDLDLELADALQDPAVGLHKVEEAEHLREVFRLAPGLEGPRLVTEAPAVELLRVELPVEADDLEGGLLCLRGGHQRGLERRRRTPGERPPGRGRRGRPEGLALTAIDLGQKPTPLRPLITPLRALAGAPSHQGHQPAHQEHRQNAAESRTLSLKLL